MQPGDIERFCSLLNNTKVFDKLEVQIIKAMLSLRERRIERAAANDIARLANMSVTNAYKYLYSLQQKGLVESSKDKNKIFWLSQSSNPFPRIFSYVGRDYLNKKDVFSVLEELYKKFIPLDVVWGGEKMYENYEGNLIDRVVFIFDMAKSEILITTQKFYDDFLLLNALKRAVERGVKIKIISEEIHPELTKKMREINIEIRLGLAWPYVIVADGSHGMTVDNEEKGIWFMNCKTEYKKKFDEQWQKAETI